MLGYWAMKALSWMLCHSPKFIRKIFASFLGSVAWAVTPAWRKTMAVENIKDCLGVPEERAKEIAEASVRRFGRMLVEVLRFPTLTPENFRKSVNIEGTEYLEAAFKQDKGVILCTGHYGNWELLGASVALLGYPILSIARKQNNSAMDDFINEYRELTGQKITYNRGENSMLAINRIIKDKKTLVSFMIRIQGLMVWKYFSLVNRQWHLRGQHFCHAFMVRLCCRFSFTMKTMKNLPSRSIHHFTLRKRLIVCRICVSRRKN